MQEKPLEIAFRIQRIIDWLKENRARIERPGKMKLTFDCRDNDIVARLEFVDHIAKEKI